MLANFIANFIVYFDQVVFAADRVVSRTVSVSLVIIMIHMQTPGTGL